MPSSLHFPEADRTAVLRHYEARQETSAFTSEAFISNLGWRIYTEWCCGEGRGQSHGNFQLTPHWEDFINQQVHFALERRDGRMAIEDDDGEKKGIYLEARTAIIAAVVARAIMLFNDWGGTTPSSRQNPPDTRNLRADLAPHVRDHQFA